MLNLDLTNFPTLETNRLTLRNVLEKDYELFYKLHSDPVINRFVGRENSSSLEKAKAYIKRMDGLVKNKECFFWVITLNDDDNLMGSVCCWNFDLKNGIVEIGYEMLSEFQGKGFMTEALKSVIEFTFNKIKANIITAFPSSDNINSVKILKKLNFEFENKPYNNKHANVKNCTTYTLRP